MTRAGWQGLAMTGASAGQGLAMTGAGWPGPAMTGAAVSPGIPR